MKSIDLTILLIVAACAQERPEEGKVRYRDPLISSSNAGETQDSKPVDEFGKTKTSPADSIELRIGFYQEERFVGLDEDSNCQLAYGFQGGTWSMPTIQVKGFGEFNHVECSILLGERQIGKTITDVQFLAAQDNFLETRRLPIPVTVPQELGEASDIKLLFGSVGHLTCLLQNNALNLAREATFEVTFVEGDP
jgi:hypothetical protein